MKKIAIIGANEFQNKLILKAKSLGVETHVFAWEEGAVGRANSDYFYSISITEKEKILEQCKKVKIDGICSIASDLAMLTVNYIAEKLNLVGNSLECTQLTTNKYKMRERLYNNFLPCPYFKLVKEIEDIRDSNFNYPMIIKPTDRSGSRGIYKVNNKRDLIIGVEKARKVSFNKEVILEEYIGGEEYSVEGISQNGKHNILQITKKYTTGAPNFIEIAHEQPSNLSKNVEKKVKEIVVKSLNVLKIKNGATHTEIKIENGQIKIIEIGARMGGDFIGSDLVKISTGIDFLKLVIDVALNNSIEITKIVDNNYAFVKFLFNKEDLEKINKLIKEQKKYIKEIWIKENFTLVTDSSTRNGYCIFDIRDKNILSEIKEVIL